ncbi:MAG: hypothetical protein ACM3SR_18990 [Ignavibacteriales bacterium]
MLLFVASVEQPDAINRESHGIYQPKALVTLSWSLPSLSIANLVGDATNLTALEIIHVFALIQQRAYSVRPYKINAAFQYEIGII